MLETFRPLLDAARGVDLDDPAAAERELNRRFDPAGPAASALGDELQRLFREGRIAERGELPVRWGRAAKPSPESGDFSIDVVVMNGAGPRHRHPGGEWIFRGIALEGDPQFDGRPPGWVVYGPDSTHVPTVAGGTMLIVYLLPAGQMEFLGVSAARLVSNPPNPYSSLHVEWLGEPPSARVEVQLDATRSMLAKNDSPDIPFRYSANAYRGCQHACAYCYARIGHEHLGFGAGTDFETRLVVKRDAPQLLASELARPGWKREVVAISGSTDPYQPLEACWELTRGMLAACLAHNTPVAVITKGALVRRDIDLLAELARGPGAIVHISIPFREADLARALEPGAPTPAERFEAMAALAAAGIPTGLSLAPLIPGLDEGAIPELVERAAAAGARSCFATLLRLPGSVHEVFFERLTRALPLRAAHVRSALLDTRQGRTRDARFEHRMRGEGPRWKALEYLLRIACKRHGLELGEARRPRLPPAPDPGPPSAAHSPATGQLELF